MLKKDSTEKKIIEYEEIIYKFARQITFDLEEMEKVDKIVENQLYGANIIPLL